jgi:hypothetical protein
MTSPFLDTYVEKWEPELCPVQQSYHYDSDQGCIDRIVERGGMAVLAHPWNYDIDYGDLSGFTGMEIYSAYAEYQHCCEGAPDRNATLLRRWDQLLSESSTRIWGFGVNDWYGPWWEEAEDFPEVADSGKTLAMVREYSLKSYRTAIEDGAFFAVRDMGTIKGLVPSIESISVAGNSMVLESDGAVSWIAGGRVVGSGPSFSLDSLPESTRYVRAEVANEHGTVYLQPFSLAGACDADGDHDVDLRDFGSFQTCFRVIFTSECLSVFDVNESTVIDETDYVEFHGRHSDPD